MTLCALHYIRLDHDNDWPIIFFTLCVVETDKLIHALKSQRLASFYDWAVEKYPVSDIQYVYVTNKLATR